MKLSVIVPVYNEEKTVEKILKKLQTNISKINQEIIVVNDGSTDKTFEIVTKFISKNKKIKFFSNKNNSGKGSAVQKGIKHATGDYIIIQDADLEYDPVYFKELISPIVKDKYEVVFGTRLHRLPNLQKDERNLFIFHYFGNRFLSFVTSILYFNWITDMETCYKIFPRKTALKLQLKARGFDFEPEITAKLLKRGYKIKEIPISTNPRGYKEGKKLKSIPTGIQAIWTLLKYRFVD